MMDPKTKQKFDRLVNWLLAGSVCVTIAAVAMATNYRARSDALQAEVQRLLDTAPARCPASIQHAFRRAI